MREGFLPFQTLRLERTRYQKEWKTQTDPPAPPQLGGESEADTTEMKEKEGEGWEPPDMMSASAGRIMEKPM